MNLKITTEGYFNRIKKYDSYRKKLAKKFGDDIVPSTEENFNISKPTVSRIRAAKDYADYLKLRKPKYKTAKTTAPKYSSYDGSPGWVDCKKRIYGGWIVGDPEPEYKRYSNDREPQELAVVLLTFLVVIELIKGLWWLVTMIF